MIKRTLEKATEQIKDLLKVHEDEMDRALAMSEDGKLSVSIGLGIRRDHKSLNILDTKISYVVEKRTDAYQAEVDEMQPALPGVGNAKEV